MHNSIILFLLVGLLVMLIPFGSSMNIFLNALAVEMNPDMNNKQIYLKDMKDFIKMITSERLIIIIINNTINKNKNNQQVIIMTILMTPTLNQNIPLIN